MNNDEIEDIRKFLKNEKIPGARTDALIIRRFLDGCNNDLEMAKQKMRNYYEMRNNVSEWFQQRDPLQCNLRDLLEKGVMLPLPVKDEHGRTVILVRATVNNPRTHPMTDVFKISIMIVDLAFESDETIAKNGVHLVVDLDGVSLGHALQMTPRLVRRAANSWQDCYPIRIAGIDFVNCPPHVDIVLRLFRKFLREKLRKRIRTHGRNHSELCKIVDPNCLPHEYGGRCGSLKSVIRHWTEKVLSNRDWYLGVSEVTSG